MKKTLQEMAITTALLMVTAVMIGCGGDKDKDGGNGSGGDANVPGNDGNTNALPPVTLPTGTDVPKELQK